MKKACLLIICFIFATFLSAQQTGLSWYALTFVDKGVNPDEQLTPILYLSGKSVERRLKYQIPFDQSDIPVHEQYVQDVVQAGAKVLARSRWFNTIVIEANNDILAKLALLPQISNIQHLGVAGLKRANSDKFVKPSFEAETVNPLTDATILHGMAELNQYGAAFSQIDQIRGQYLHNLGFTGQGMTIAVLDAGFNSVDVLPCFESMRANNQLKGARDFTQPGNNVFDKSMASHGTSVLSCMAAFSTGEMVGTAPKADYWLLRSEVVATESIIEEYYWVSAAEFADSVGVDFINSSLGYTTFPHSPEADHTYADMDGNTTFVTKGADKAAEKGILVVNSAGNSGGTPWKYIGAPADGDSVLSIGSVDASGNRSFFSSVGPTSDGRITPSVMARGTGTAIYTPSGLVSGSGTSFSSPVICGMAACLWQAYPHLNNMQIMDLIKSSGNKAGTPDSQMGWGIPDFEKAGAILSVKDKDVKENILIYPNPAAGKITVSVPVSVQGKFTMEIINVQGKVVYRKLINSFSGRSIQINDLGFLRPGIYSFRISDRSTIYTGKVIKM